MDTNNGKKNNLLSSFDEITLAMIHSNPDAAKSFLKEEGLDPAEELKNGLSKTKKISFLLKAKNNQAKDKSLLEEAFKKLKQSIIENAQKTTDTLIELLQAKTPAVQYRKLEKWTDEEIRDVLNDVDLVKLMEELDKGC